MNKLPWSAQEEVNTHQYIIPSCENMYGGHKWCALIRNKRLRSLQVMREVLLKGCNLKAPSRPRNWQVQRPWGRKRLLCAVRGEGERKGWLEMSLGGGPASCSPLRHWGFEILCLPPGPGGSDEVPLVSPGQGLTPRRWSAGARQAAPPPPSSLLRRNAAGPSPLCCPFPRAPPAGHSGSAGWEWGLRGADIGPGRGSGRGPGRGPGRPSFGRQAPSAAHFPVSFAFSLKSFICEGSSQMLCHEAYSSKRSVTGAGGQRVWPLRASSLPGLPLQAPSCPRQPHFGRGGGENVESYPARVGTGSPCARLCVQKAQLRLCGCRAQGGGRHPHRGPSMLLPAHGRGAPTFMVGVGSSARRKTDLSASSPVTPRSG